MTVNLDSEPWPVSVERHRLHRRARRADFPDSRGGTGRAHRDLLPVPAAVALKCGSGADSQPNAHRLQFTSNGGYSWKMLAPVIRTGRLTVSCGSVSPANKRRASGRTS